MKEACHYADAVTTEAEADLDGILDRPSIGNEEQDTKPQPTANTPPAHPIAPCTVSPPIVEPHGILQAPREPALCLGGRFGFGVATEVLFSKFVLHVPLYRQQDMWVQSGWSPSRSTLGLRRRIAPSPRYSGERVGVRGREANAEVVFRPCLGQIVATSAELLVPLAELLRERVLASPVLGTDDTPVTLLTPGIGEGSRQARFWLYRGPATAPFNVFAFTDSRAREGPDRFLETFTGTLTGDCYSGYVNIEKITRGRIRFAACVSHARRKVFDAREQQPALSSQVLAPGRMGLLARRAGAVGSRHSRFGGPTSRRLESRAPRTCPHVPHAGEGNPRRRPPGPPSQSATIATQRGAAG